MRNKIEQKVWDEHITKLINRKWWQGFLSEAEKADIVDDSIQKVFHPELIRKQN